MPIFARQGDSVHLLENDKQEKPEKDYGQQFFNPNIKSSWCFLTKPYLKAILGSNFSISAISLFFVLAIAFLRS
jgi:hypothetical protein